MGKTLLLVFIHGFKGGDNTFGTFPEHLRALISHALPKIDVVAITYPKFETKGELKNCVERFREWLQNKVIDLEVAHSTPSPTIEPSVHTVLIGHSMGGIVAAETLLLLANDRSLPSSFSPGHTSSNAASNTTLNAATGIGRPMDNSKQSESSNGTTSSHHTKTTDDNDKSSCWPNPMFPQVVGLLAFDTPFLGIAPGVIAHGAEGHYKNASSAYNTFSELGSAFGWGSSSPTSTSSTSKSKGNSTSVKTPTSQPAGLLANGNGLDDAAASPRWQSWGKYAMFAGAAGAVAAGGAAALYSQREKLTSGWGWVSGHLEFVGCLLRGEDLRGRVERIGGLATDGQKGEKGGKAEKGSQNKFGGSAVFYTVLGRGANSNTSNAGAQILLNGTGQKRTFCKLPPFLTTGTSKISTQKFIQGTRNENAGLRWIPALNDKATDEIAAHTSMFYPRENPAFYSLGERAKEVVCSWIIIDQAWYDSTIDLYDAAETARNERKKGGQGNVANEPEHGASKRASYQASGKTFGEVGDDEWEKPDHNEGVKAKRGEKDRGTGMSESVWVHGGDSDDDVRMRDGSVDAEDLESGSVVIDKAC